jgi:hypothetical protein
MDKNFNQAIYNTKYYYVDQNLYLFRGDYNYMNKLWRSRSRTKKYITFCITGYILLYLHYKYALKNHIKDRNYVMKMNNININSTK